MNFYVLQSPSLWTERALYGKEEWYHRFRDARWVGKEIRSHSVICPVDPGHQRSSGRQSNLVVTLPGSKVGDFHYTVYGEKMITDRVLELFTQASVTGFEVRPVDVRLVGGSRRDKAPVEMPRLWEFVITGHGGKAHPSCGINLLIECRACGMVRYSSYNNGITVDREQWDGSDVFDIIEWPDICLVTEKVKELIVSHELTNVVLLPAERLRWPDDIPRPEDIDWE